MLYHLCNICLTLNHYGAMIVLILEINTCVHIAVRFTEYHMETISEHFYSLFQDIADFINKYAWFGDIMASIVLHPL